MIDFSIDDIGSPIMNRDIDLLLQQIDILFDTTPKEVLGAESFGTTYDSYLHRLKLSNNAIKQQVISDISSLDLQGFDFDVDVHFLHGSEQDIALIDIVFTKDERTYNRTYKIV